MFPSTARQRSVILWWSLVSGLIHVVWEGAWSVAAPFLQGPAALHGWRLYWTLYGLADHRYLHADPFVRVLELVTGTVVAALNLYVAYHVWKRRQVARAMVALLVASVMEVYGTVMYFGSEMLEGWRNVDTHSFVHTWVMFFGLNAIWFVFPGWCIYDLARHYAAEGRRYDRLSTAESLPATTCA
jgi:hypothetical protein